MPRRTGCGSRCYAAICGRRTLPTSGDNSARARAISRRCCPSCASCSPICPDRRVDRQTPHDFRLFDSAATLLRNASTVRPILLVLDDLQAADASSILLLRFLAAQLSEMPILLVGTYRDIELTPEHPLTSALIDIEREPHTQRILLGGLGADAIGRFIAAASDGTSHQRLAAAIWRETSGNPLYVGAAIRLLAAEGKLSDVADVAALRVAVPASVRAVIARRIGHLQEDTARVLAAAAVLGPEFNLEILRRIADMESDRALDLLDEAVEAGLLLPVAGSLGRYRFSHDVVRETLYDELSTATRARLHLSAARVIEEVHPGAIEAHLAELAFHSVEATRGGEARRDVEDARPLGPRAIDYSRRAGDAAGRSLAFEEAARLYRMALAVLDIADGPDDETRIETLLALGDVLTRAAALDDARTSFLEAAELARHSGSGTRFARAALGYGGRSSWARPGKDTLLIPLLQDAIAILGDGDERLRIRLMTRLACALRSSPERFHDGDRLSRDALQLARRLDDPESLSYALGGRFWATWGPDNPDERTTIVSEMVDVAKVIGDEDRIADTYAMLFMSHSERGLMAEARREAANLTRYIEEIRQPALHWYGTVNLSELALIEGDFERADELLTLEMGSGRRVTPARDDVSASRMQRFLLRREQGRVAEEEATVRASIDDFPWYPVHRAALACLLLDAGRVSEARVVFAALARDDFAAIYKDNEWLLGMAVTAEACHLLADTAAATVLYDRLVPYAGRHAIGHMEGSVGAVDRYLGLLAVTLGRLDDAERHLAAAVEINDWMEAWPWAAHSRHDLAAVLTRRDAPGDPARAQELDAAALVTTRRLGMALTDRITATPEVGGDPATRPRDTSDAPFTTAVFRREGEYWTIEFGSDAFRIRDARGLRHLARLLSAPGREIHAIELSRLDGPGAQATALAADPGMSVVGSGDAGPTLDAEAKAAYRMRLLEIRDELAEAERWNDPERVARLQADEDALVHELSAAIGLGGRDRNAASPSERARVSVTRAIRATMGRIAEQSPSLDAHLAATIHTGTFCSYTPDPRAPIIWRS